MASTEPHPIPTVTHPAATAGFVRDQATVLSYAALGCFTFWLYAFAPAVTLLRGELGFSYAVLGLYSVFWAGGSAIAGLAFTWLAANLSRGTQFWSSAALAVVGAALFALTSGVGATLAAAAIFGFAGTTLLAVIQGILSDRHGARRDKALTEANIGGGLSSILAPLATGGLAATTIGWRFTFALPAVVFVVLYLVYRNRAFQSLPRRESSARSGGLSLTCWMFIGLMAVGSAIEFCLVYFAPQALIAIGMSTAAASAALVSNFLGILVGRIAGASLTHRPGRAVPLLAISLVVTTASFSLFWLSGQPVLAVLALFFCGVGVANLYPLALSLTLDASAGLEDKANARSQLAVGLVVAVAPFALGSLADQAGLFTAFGIVPLLIVISALLLWAGLRRRRQDNFRNEPKGE